MKSLSVIIPAFNEEKSLGEVLPNVVEYCRLKNYQLILVDDGSDDKTGDLMEEFNRERFIKIIHNKVNSGYGASIKNAIKMAETDYVITIDADGQHRLEDIEKLFQLAIEREAEMVVGNRGKSSGNYRSIGKWLIRNVAGALMPLNIKDINSGMKLYDRKLALKYCKICPETMAYSDVILLAFVFRKHRVIEAEIKTNPRKGGKSTITIFTAIDTLKEVINIIILFNPIRVFFPVGVLFILFSAGWEAHIFMRGNGVSIGSMLGFVTGILVLFVGLLAHQISAFRRESLE
jgi:glycosyltransferase involved in cell wall biosynthesis